MPRRERIALCVAVGGLLTASVGHYFFSLQEQRKCPVYGERVQRPVQFSPLEALCREQLADGTWAVVWYWKE